MFRMRLTVDREQIAILRALPDRARRNMRRHLQTDFKDYMQALVDELLPSLEPDTAQMPFQFGTEKSKWYYLHVMVPQGLVPTDGEHYARTGNMDASWAVTVSDYFTENLVRIDNPTTAAKYVYGPYQVAGHIASGWGTEFSVARDALHEKAVARIGELWHQSVVEARRGTDYDG